MSNLRSPIGLVAGNGNFPLEFVENAKAGGLETVVAAHIGETDRRVEDAAAECFWVRIGQFGRILSIFKKRGVKQAAFVGGIRRAGLFNGFRPDFKALSIMARAGSFKDDVILRAVAREMEKNGIEVFAAGELLRNSVPCAGILTRRSLSGEERIDALVGFDVAKGIGALDIGQTVVAYQKAVVAVEAVEGTDAAISRAGELGGTSGGCRPEAGLVVIKLVKPQQDVRFDLPAAGPDTIAVMQRAGASALVLEAGRAVILDPQATVRAANQAGIAIVVVRSKEDLGHS